MLKIMKDRLKTCEQFRDNRSTPSVSEKGKTFQIDNKERYEVACVKVDDCVFNKKDGIKCDFLFEIAAKKKLFYVELKGSDIIKAIRQIGETLKQTNCLYPNWNYEARIIAGSTVPASIYDRREFEILKKNCNGGQIKIHHKNLHIETL